MTLSEFLLARIAEDEATIGPPPHRADWEPIYPGSRNRLEFTHDGLMIEPSRAWAECEAKRRLLRFEPCDDWSYGLPCEHVRALALPYVDHPDYCDDWRVE